MTNERFWVVLVALGVASLVPLACDPQVVDAVNTQPETGGAGPTGGVAGTVTTGGNVATGGLATGGLATGGGTACPDGGTDVADRDGDGTPDCADACDDDPRKTNLGYCGCGFVEPEDAGPPSCADLVNMLAHRYTFNGFGTAVVDSKGGDPGVVMGGIELTGTGTLALAGAMSEQYADLPNRILSTLPSVTLEAWVQWTGGAAWQRIFDFGNNDGPGQGQQGSGTSYLFLTARTPNNPTIAGYAPQTAKLRLAYKRPGTDEWEITIDAPIAMPSGVTTPTQVVAVIDREAKRTSLYIDGLQQNAVVYFRRPGNADSKFTRMDGAYDWSTPVMTPDGNLVTPPAMDLSLVDDINNWLGRSQFTYDNELQGTYHEFRIYAGALNAEQVAISFKAGPDPTFFDD